MNLIDRYKHHFIQNGRPTALVKKLRGTPAGEMVLKTVLAYYLTNTDHTQRCDEELDLNININDYKWKE